MSNECNSHSKMSDKLNYNIDSVEDRLNEVKKIVGSYDDGVIGEYDEYLTNYYSNNYNPHINQTGLLSENSRVGKDLETLANYILYAKDSEASDDTITDYRKKRNNMREASINEIIKVKTNKRETNKSIFKIQKIKVTKEDRKQYKDLAQTGEVIERLTYMIDNKKDFNGKEIQEKEIRKLKWIRTDIQKDEVTMKTELKKYVKFNSVTKSEKDLTALSHIRFDDVNIIRILIEDYSELRESSYEDTYGYMKSIIFTLDELIEMTNIEDYIKDVLVWKIEKANYDEMISMIQDKYDMKITKPRLSKLTRDTIPSMIVETYKQHKEEWLYTYIYKGSYKTCLECKENYLAIKKYFGLDKTSKTGLRSVCKECRRKKYKTSISNE